MSHVHTISAECQVRYIVPTLLLFLMYHLVGESPKISGETEPLMASAVTKSSIAELFVVRCSRATQRVVAKDGRGMEHKRKRTKATDGQRKTSKKRLLASKLHRKIMQNGGKVN